MKLGGLMTALHDPIQLQPSFPGPFFLSRARRDLRLFPPDSAVHLTIAGDCFVAKQIELQMRGLLFRFKETFR